MNFSAYSPHLTIYRAIAVGHIKQLRPSLGPLLVQLLPLLIVCLILLVPELAWAAEKEGTAGIFDKIGDVLEEVANDLTTSGWLKWIGVLAIAIGGVLFAVGELNGPFGYVIRIVAGLAVALGSTALAASFGVDGEVK